MTTGERLDLRYSRPWLYGKQESALFHPERYGVVEASTKSGKTVACLVWLFEKAAQEGKPGRSYWWAAPVYAQAAIAYGRLKRFLPIEISRLCQWHGSELRVTLWNGAVLWFKGAEKPDNLYGEDVFAAIIDEASRVREESWYAIRSTLTATEGPVRIIGNVKGRRNWAYRMARLAEAGEPGMHYSRITAYDAIDAGVLSKEEVADAKRMLPDRVYRELYEAEPSDDTANPFGMDYIQAAMMADLSPGEPKAWGWDLGKSQDWTVGVGLDAEGRVCRFFRFQRPWEDTIPIILSETGRIPSLVDSTGVGDPILERLQKGGTNYEGYKYTTQSKQQLMEGLVMAVQRRTVMFPEGVIAQEMESFEYTYTRTGVRYTAPEGLHDDCVNALALAVRKLAYEPRAIGASGGRPIRLPREF